MPNILSLVVAVALMACVSGLMIPNPRVLKTSTRTRSSLGMSSSYLEELANARGQERKCLVGLTTDSWNIGTRKYARVQTSEKQIHNYADCFCC